MWWFQSYLIGRKQRVMVDYEISKWTAVYTGVPQGSIIGPLLFSILVNDLPAALSRCKVMLYADDTTMYYSEALRHIVLVKMDSKSFVQCLTLRKRKLILS